MLLAKALVVSGNLNMRWRALLIPAAHSVFLALSKKYTSQTVINFEQREWGSFAGKHIREQSVPGMWHSWAGGRHSWMGWVGTAGWGAGTALPLAVLRTHSIALWAHGFCAMKPALLQL